MPKLQIDGETVAEISQEIADKLRHAAKAGMGNVFQSRTIQGPSPSDLRSGRFQTVIRMWEPNRHPIAIEIVMLFPRPA